MILEAVMDDEGNVRLMPFQGRHKQWAEKKKDE